MSLARDVEAIRQAWEGIGRGYLALLRRTGRVCVPLPVNQPAAMRLQGLAPSAAVQTYVEFSLLEGEIRGRLGSSHTIVARDN